VASIVHAYNIHDLLTLRIRRRRATAADSFLDSTFVYYRTDRLESDPDIDVEIGPFAADTAGALLLDGRWYVRPDAILYDTRMKIARWRTEIRGLDGDRLRVRIDANYPARMVFPGETIYSLIRLRLAQKGLLLLHAPAVAAGGKALLLPARGGTGKTITAIRFARAGWGFMGDDSSILAADGVRSFIVPFNLRFTYDVERFLGIRFVPRKRLEIFLKRCLSLATLGSINLFSRIDARDVFGDRIVHRAALGAVYILIQGAEPAVSPPQPADLAARSVLINTLFEADELRAMLLAYGYGNPGSPLKRVWDDFGDRLAERLGRCVCRRVTVPPDYPPEVFEMIRRQAERDLSAAAGLGAEGAA
jgi:hypothetical protein